jgi:hypothetical protein
MVEYMRYILAYLDECELIRLLPVEADNEEEAQALVDELAPGYLPVGFREAAFWCSAFALSKVNHA